MFLIDILHTENCSGKKEALKNLVEALNELGFNTKDYFLNIREIKTDKEAKLWKLAGSPTIKVNGRDIAFNNHSYGLFERKYLADKNAPEVNIIKEALHVNIRERIGIKKIK